MLDLSDQEVTLVVSKRERQYAPTPAPNAKEVANRRQIGPSLHVPKWSKEGQPPLCAVYA